MFGDGTGEVVVNSLAPVISAQTYSPGVEEISMQPILARNFSEVDALGGIDVADEAFDTSPSAEKRTPILLLGLGWTCLLFCIKFNHS